MGVNPGERSQRDETENAFRYLGPDPELRFGKSPTEKKNNDPKSGKISLFSLKDFVMSKLDKEG